MGQDQTPAASRLIVGIDYGTTYSGVTFSYSPEGECALSVLTEWQEAVEMLQNDNKVNVVRSATYGFKRGSVAREETLSRIQQAHVLSKYLERGPCLSYLNGSKANAHHILLTDTPGFDDGTGADADMTKKLTIWLAQLKSAEAQPDLKEGFNTLRHPVEICRDFHSQYHDFLELFQIGGLDSIMTSFQIHWDPADTSFTRCMTLSFLGQALLYNHCKRGLKSATFFPKACDLSSMEIPQKLVGDDRIGPQFQPALMGREDDDDDDCVGFRSMSGIGNCHAEAASPEHAASDLRSALPQYGTPKRDPVAASSSTPTKSFSLGFDFTISIWRDAVARTYGGGTRRDLPAPRGEWKCCNCNRNGYETMDQDLFSKESLLRAH